MKRRQALQPYEPDHPTRVAARFRQHCCDLLLDSGKLSHEHKELLTDFSDYHSQQLLVAEDPTTLAVSVAAIHLNLTYVFVSKKMFSIAPYEIMRKNKDLLNQLLAREGKIAVL
jgi:hypothetical protein